MKRKNPLVSVIIPTRNRFKLLKRSINSVLYQTYKNIEVIVVDDASTDKTHQFFKSIKDKRVRLIRLKKHQGAAKARNAGLKKAKGELIAFNDDDDIWDKKKLEKQVRAFAKASPKVGVVYTRIKRTRGKGVKYFPDEVVGEKDKREGKIQKELYLENFVGLPTAMIRKECFEKVGLFDEELPCYEDWELFLRVGRHFRFKYLPQTLVEAPILPTGLTSKRKVVLKASEIIFNKHKREIKKDKEILAAWQFRLGDLYYHQQRMKKTRDFFTQALKNKPSFKYFRAIVKTFLGKGISETLIGWKISLVGNWQLLAILILALFLRLINLNQSLWLDEAVQAITSKGSFLGIFQELKGDFHPPLYHLLMWLWVHLFGSREIILRLPSVIFGVATVYVVYKIGKVISDQRSGFSDQRSVTSVQKITGYWIPITGALFLATAPFHIYYSQEARNYALTTFLAALSMYYFMRATSDQRSGSRGQKKTEYRLLVAGYLLSTTLLLYTNYFGLFILLAQILAALVVARRLFFRFLVFQFLCLLLFLPWLPMFLTQLQVGHQATTSLPEWGRLVNVNFLKALPLTFIKFSIGRITIFNKKIYALIAGILFIIYGGIIGKVIGDQWSVIRKNWLLITGCWLLIPILCAWLISFFIPNYQPFRLLLVLPAFYLFLVWGISQIKTTTIRIIVVVFILLVNLVSAGVYYTNAYFYREDWRGLVQFIESQPEEEKIAILPSQTSHWPWSYYSLGKAKLISVSSGIKEVTKEDLENLRIEQLKNWKIYYIRYLVPMFDPQEQTISSLNQNGFVKIKEVSFNQIPVWIYRRHQ